MDIIIFTSALHDTSSITGMRLEAIRKHFAGQELTFHNFGDDFAVGQECACFIATGGTEELFSRVWRALPQPIVLVSDGYHNSFAASFETASFLEQQGVAHELINLPMEDGGGSGDASGVGRDTSGAAYGTSAEIAPSFDPYADERVLKTLATSSIGLIGGASSWLISSDIDREAVSARFGAKFIDIPLDEVEEAYKAQPAGDVTETAATYSREALSDAERMYRALKAICERYDLTSLTIKCFDLLGSCLTTSCLALARLSDEGIISGCEGDIPSLWTLIVARALSGRPAFMANPSSSCPDDCTVDFAHCTIPLSMCSKYTLPSHFESGIGIGVAGILVPGPCKLLKIGGPLLDKVYSASGTIECNTHIAARCRTQIRFRFPSPAEMDRFLSNRLGNHIILYR